MGWDDIREKGRKDYLFCWTEIGAEYAGVFQRLLATCCLQGIDPYTYLVDVLQRVDRHPAREVEWLKPRLWKERFAATPPDTPSIKLSTTSNLETGYKTGP